MQNSDKLHFKKSELTNGHFLYTQKSNQLATFVRIVIPIGNAHAHIGNKYCNDGYFHFLEHMCFERSNKYLDKSEYNNLLAKTGSRQNAWTDAFYTEFSFEAPAQTFHIAFSAFLDHLISPAFISEDIELEKGIIINERTQRKFFPGTDKLSQYILTKWMDCNYYSREQIFGDDQTLEAITPELLQLNHQYYFSNPISIFIAGTFDLTTVTNELSKIPKILAFKALETKINYPSWTNKKWHEYISTDIDTYTIYFGGIFNNYNVNDVWGIDFILQLLTHEEFGTLQNWIRKDNGWSYGLEPDIEYEKDRMIWSIKIPLNSYSVVKEIRTKIHKRIQTTIVDSDLIALTRERLLLQTSFDYETISSRLDRAVFAINTAGYVQTQTDYKTWLAKVDKNYIATLYTKYFTPEHMGEFLAVPKTV